MSVKAYPYSFSEELTSCGKLWWPTSGKMEWYNGSRKLVEKNSSIGCWTTNCWVCNVVRINDTAKKYLLHADYLAVRKGRNSGWGVGSNTLSQSRISRLTSRLVKNSMPLSTPSFIEFSRLNFLSHTQNSRRETQKYGIAFVLVL